MRYLILAATVLLTASPALAASNEAWAQLRQQAERSCIEASDFRQPRVSNPIIFDDTVGMVALLVTGKFKPAHMKGASGTNLCLYDRRTQRAVVEEAKGWRERP
mgnify:CR=1 FL=1|jgi:hypothetical protein